MSERTPERRLSARAAVELPIEYERLNALLSDYTHNISKGGTFIRTDRPLPVGTVLSFTIVAPKLESPVILRGAVKWIVQPEEAAPDRPAGMGIAFVFDSPEEKAELEGRLDRLMVETLGAAAFEKLMGKPAPTDAGAR